MLEEIQQIQPRMDAVWANIIAMPPSRTRFDLIKMHYNVEKLISKLQQEMVICKRKKTISQRALSLLKEIETDLDSLEQYLTMGILISK